MEETATQSRGLKFTIKLKNEKNVDGSSSAADPLNSVKKSEASGTANVYASPVSNSKDQVNLSPAGGGSENHSSDDEENPTDSSQYQLVIYNPAANGTGEGGSLQDPTTRPHSLANQAPRVFPSIGAFTVQCANCFKWRLIPTKEKYEEIREHIMEQPFFCESGREWRPDISCEDPPDITQDGSRLWAIDKPSIAQPPPGWQRLLRIRSEGSSKFADVYYVSPLGKRLRSMVEVQRHLDEHPEYIEGGISLSKFSFQIPRPLQEDYVRKRPARPPPTPEVVDHGMPGPSFDPVAVKPISWIRPVDTDFQLSQPGISVNPSNSHGPMPETQMEKKKKTPAKRRSDGNIVHNQNGVNGQEPQML